MTEKQLIMALKKGDEKAFELLYERYRRLVYFVIFNVLKNPETSEEIMQDTFLKMYHNIQGFDGRYFQAWLLKIAKNLALNQYQKDQKYQKFIDNLNVQEADGDRATLNMMDELAEILNDNEYEVVILTIIYRLKQREIAQYLKKPVGTISWLYQQGTRKLKNYYKKRRNGSDNSTNKKTP